MSVLLEPFGYEYMLNAMWVSAMVGGLCAFLSCYLMLKGWSLIGDALSHSIVPGVAGAYMLGLPFSLGAFLSGGLAAGSMLFLNQRSRLKEDAIIGLIFLLFRSGAVYGLTQPDLGEYSDYRPREYPRHCPGRHRPAGDYRRGVDACSAVQMERFDGDLFDENHARAIGLRPERLKILSLPCWRFPPWLRCKPSAHFW
jgi:manganese/iron transport system permease protein